MSMKIIIDYKDNILTESFICWLLPGYRVTYSELLKRIKTYLKNNSTSENRLNGLSLLIIHGTIDFP